MTTVTYYTTREGNGYEIKTVELENDSSRMGAYTPILTAAMSEFIKTLHDFDSIIAIDGDFGRNCEIAGYPAKLPDIGNTIRY